MHTNHRRKRIKDKSPRAPWWRPRSFHPEKKFEARRFRRRTKNLLQAKRYSEVWRTVTNDIIWNYW